MSIKIIYNEVKYRVNNFIYDIKQLYKCYYIYKISVLDIEKDINKEGKLHFMKDRFSFIKTIEHNYSWLCIEKSILIIKFIDNTSIEIEFSYDEQKLNYYITHSNMKCIKRGTISFNEIQSFTNVVDLIIYMSI